MGNVPVPAPNYMPGIRPEDVKDPAVREKYIAAIKANTIKARKFNLQLQLHRLDKTLPDFVESFLVQMYSMPPLRLDELKNNLRLFSLEDERKERIINSVSQSRDFSYETTYETNRQNSSM